MIKFLFIKMIREIVKEEVSRTVVREAHAYQGEQEDRLQHKLSMIMKIAADANKKISALDEESFIDSVVDRINRKRIN